MRFPIEKLASPPVVGATVVVLALLAACFLCGCATTESDMPWNVPQPWEGSPTIPGMPNYNE